MQLRQIGWNIRQRQVAGFVGITGRLHRPLGVFPLLFGVLIWISHNDASAQAPPESGTRQPPLVVNIQYVKNLSFVVPGAPQIYARQS
jgi:hypothetical protein